jgi:V/A-type H+/Na+-transporting ATPase subunit I
MIVKMKRVEIISPQKHLDPVLHLLQDIGELHIQEVLAPEDNENMVLLHRFHLSEPLEKEKALLEDLLKMIEEIFRLSLNQGRGKTLSAEPIAKEDFREEPLEKIHFRVTTLNTRLKSLVRRKRNIEDDLAVAQKYGILVKRFLPVIQARGEGAGFEYVGITMPTKEKHTLADFTAKMAEIVREKHTLFAYDFADGQTVVLLAFHGRYAAEVKNLLWHEGISELRVPAEFESLPLDETLRSLHQKLVDLPADIAKIHQQIEKLSRDHGLLIQTVRDVCLDRLEHFNVFSKIALTSQTFILNAWVPATSVEDIHRLLDGKFDGAVLVHELDFEGVEPAEIPIKLKNSALVKPFELLLSFFPPPKYGTVDPSPLIAVFFPLFFGMILGDIAYGLIVGLIGLIIRVKSPGGTVLHRLSAIFLFASFWTVVFGFLYGEFLGNLAKVFGLHAIHPFFHRETAILPSLIMALSVGATHIVLGYVLSMIISLRERNTHKLVEKIAELGGVFGLFLMIGSFAKLLSPVFFVSGAGLLMVALTVMIALHNFLAPLEIIKTVGNILSYARIMAIGISSVILAIVANRFSGMMGNIIVGVIIAGLLHILNIALGIFSPSIHSVRLHYVEFFSKFYQAEGKRYLPFKRRGGDVI